ncbi:MAG: hypothetical protein CMJ47_00650 [Planctomyces sp.]|nr:hypothetical protein [Planctomyces sp.]
MQKTLVIETAKLRKTFVANSHDSRNLGNLPLLEQISGREQLNRWVVLLRKFAFFLKNERQQKVRSRPGTPLMVVCQFADLLSVWLRVPKGLRTAPVG